MQVNVDLLDCIINQMKRTLAEYEAQQQLWPETHLKSQGLSEGHGQGSFQSQMTRKTPINEQAWKSGQNIIPQEEDQSLYQKPLTRLFTEEKMNTLMKRIEVTEELQKPNSSRILNMSYNFNVERVRAHQELKEKIYEDVERYYAKDKAQLRDAFACWMARSKQQEGQSISRKIEPE